MTAPANLFQSIQNHHSRNTHVITVACFRSRAGVCSPDQSFFHVCKVIVQRRTHSESLSLPLPLTLSLSHAHTHRQKNHFARLHTLCIHLPVLQEQAWHLQTFKWSSGFLAVDHFKCTWTRPVNLGLTCSTLYLPTKTQTACNFTTGYTERCRLVAQRRRLQLSEHQIN
jgi:hypothetical protein